MRKNRIYSSLLAYNKLSDDHCWMNTLINSLIVYGTVYGRYPKSLLKVRVRGDRQGRKMMLN